MYLLVNDIKEKACAVSLDFCADLKLAKQTEFLKLQYVCVCLGGLCCRVGCPLVLQLTTLSVQQVRPAFGWWYLALRQHSSCCRRRF